MGGLRSILPRFPGCFLFYFHVVKVLNVPWGKPTKLPLSTQQRYNFTDLQLATVVFTESRPATPIPLAVDHVR